MYLTADYCKNAEQTAEKIDCVRPGPAQSRCIWTWNRQHCRTGSQRLKNDQTCLSSPQNVHLCAVYRRSASPADRRCDAASTALQCNAPSRKVTKCQTAGMLFTQPRPSGYRFVVASVSARKSWGARLYKTCASYVTNVHEVLDGAFVRLWQRLPQLLGKLRESILWLRNHIGATSWFSRGKHRHTFESRITCLD